MKINRLNNITSNLIVFLFFASIHADGIFRNNASLITRYFFSVFCFLYPLLRRNFVISRELAIFSLATILTGLLNMLCIDNSTFFKIIYTVMSFFIGRFILSGVISEKTFLYVSYFNMLSIIIRYLQTKDIHMIYASASANYISLYLLMTVTLYYTCCEMKKISYTLTPAIAMFGLCILASGRGGILASGTLLVVVMYVKLNKTNNSRLGARVLKLSIGLIISLCILLFASAVDLSDYLGGIFSRFVSLGMSDHGRYNIWESYMMEVKTDIKYVLLGAPLNNIPIVIYFKGDLHNSFIDVHAFNGLLLCIMIIIAFAKNVFYSLRAREIVYLGCFLIIIMRGLTDQMLWGSWGTPVLAAYLFYYDKIHKMYK